jgi:hypothetical protein
MCRACLGCNAWRLPLADGRRVFIEFHSYLGPSFFLDRARQREIQTWYDDPVICSALDWFVGRGKVA